MTEGKKFKWREIPPPPRHFRVRRDSLWADDDAIRLDIDGVHSLAADTLLVDGATGQRMIVQEHLSMIVDDGRAQFTEIWVKAIKPPFPRWKAIICKWIGITALEASAEPIRKGAHLISFGEIHEEGKGFPKAFQRIRDIWGNCGGKGCSESP